MPTMWLWGGFGVALGWLWGGFGVALGWLWGGFGVALGWLWGGFGVALGCLWGAFGVALKWFWVALPGLSALCHPPSAFPKPRAARPARAAHRQNHKNQIRSIPSET